MKTVLMVAEKPSLASAISAILSGGQCTVRQGFTRGCNVHEWVGDFKGEAVRFKMTSVCGHIMSLDFEGRFNDWNATEPVELFQAPALKKEANPKMHMNRFLKSEAEGIDYLVLWLDCDREGENICFEVIDAVARSMRSADVGYDLESIGGCGDPTMAPAVFDLRASHVNLPHTGGNVEDAATQPGGSNRGRGRGRGADRDRGRGRGRGAGRGSSSPSIVTPSQSSRGGSAVTSSSSSSRGGNVRRPDTQTIFRAKFSAITETEIRHAMATLGSPNVYESLSVDARQELDLRIGCAFTRQQTKFFHGKYANLDSALISYGPCQTPTLGFCVERHDRIATFKPEDYWVLCAKVRHVSGRTVSLDWERRLTFDHVAAVNLEKALRQQQTAKVVDVASKTKTKPRPLALNTVGMLKAASQALSMGPHETMDLAERLYIQGYMSYPRTETTKYPDSFDLEGTVRAQKNAREWGDFAAHVLSVGLSKPRGGKDVGDHPPITPTHAIAHAHELDARSYRLYSLICRHFLATVGPDCKYVRTKSRLLIGDEAFTCVGITMIDPGFTRVQLWSSTEDMDNEDEEDAERSDSPPAFSANESCHVVETGLSKRQTTPPGYLTESELIALMEKHGIGTDASIAVHINNICNRNYVTVGQGRTLVPTPLGVVLIHGYQQIDPELCLPTLRSAMERDLDKIAMRESQFDAVLVECTQKFKAKFENFVARIECMDELFGATFSPAAAQSKVLSKCGDCRKYMRYVPLTPPRLHCAHCDRTYGLPSNGSIKLYKEITCPLDGFELVLFSTGTRGKSYIICPACYNNPADGLAEGASGLTGAMGCNRCTNASCDHSMARHGVCPCAECEFGTLVLDEASAPKWRIACNLCTFVLHLCEGAFALSTLQDSWCDCGMRLLEVEFSKNNSPLDNNETHVIGCMQCDEVLHSLVVSGHAQSRHPMFRRGRGGRGRGRRGRGGRGRGKGP